MAPNNKTQLATAILDQFQQVPMLLDISRVVSAVVISGTMKRSSLSSNNV
jgi:hypothetical protein